MFSSSHYVTPLHDIQIRVSREDYREDKQQFLSTLIILTRDTRNPLNFPKCKSSNFNNHSS